MSNPFQINDLAHLHDGKNIIFCKTDYLLQEFEYIRSLDNDVVLISGNSDYGIDERIFNLAPPNIKKWFAQNALYKSDILEPLPIGFENKNENTTRKGHGVGYYDRVKQKEELVESLRCKNKDPRKLIYCNFTMETNRSHRTEVFDRCFDNRNITVEMPNKSLGAFFHEVSDHKMSVCPAGNGIDTHRLWEVLACGRIPITVKMGDYKIYDLYEKLPVIILENVEQLLNNELIDEQYLKQKEKIQSAERYLWPDYWINEVLKNKKFLL